MNNKKIAVLGSTGSIGTQALDVARRLGLKVTALTANKNYRLLEQQCRLFGPEECWIDESCYGDLKLLLADTDVKVCCGGDELCRIAAQTDCDVLLNSLLGISGLMPTLAAIDGKRTLALANKETLVTGGDIVMKKIRETGTKLIPVDSEHSAIFQCIDGRSDVSSLVLTASGGAFYGKSRTELYGATAAEALRHPNWSMGAKITVDSASLMNKGFEIIEAVHLFGMPEDKIEVIIHRESIIHSMVRFKDGAVLAQLGVPDMRIPIQLAFTYPRRNECAAQPLDFSAVSSLTFSQPDTKTFGLLELAREAIRRGGNIPSAMNGADEAAVQLFLEGKISFGQIEELVRTAVEKCAYIKDPSLEDILLTDISAREAVRG